MAFRYGHITDLHLADRSFGNHQPWVQDELWRQLDEVRSLCREHRLDALFITGDFFEHKRSNLVSHRLVQRLITYFGDFRDIGTAVVAIAGNHDLGPEGLVSLDKQPLGTLAASGAIDLLREPVYLPDGIQITPLNFCDALEIRPEAYRTERFPETRYHIVLAHGSLVPDTAKYAFYTIPLSSVPSEGVDLLLYGHIHEFHGVNVVNETTFVNPGSFCRRSRTQQRDVYMALGDDTGAVGCVRLKTASPWEDLFLDIDSKLDITLNPEMAALARDARSMLSFEEIDYLAILREFSEKYPKEMIALAEEYLERTNS